MKRYIRIMLIVLLLITIPLALWGCSSKPQNPPPETVPQSPLQPEQPAQPAQPPQPDKTVDTKTQVIESVRQGQQVTELSYEVIMIGAGLSLESKAWLKQKKMKTDSLMNGQKTINIFDWAKGEVISYSPDQNMAIKMNIEEYPGLDDIKPTDYLSELEKGDFVFTGTETMNNQQCKVVMLTHGDNQVKLWISAESGLVLQIEDKTNDNTTNIEFKNLRFGAGTVPDSTFLLPEGMEVIDPNELMKGSP